MKRLVFVNRFFFPDHSATSQLLGDLAFHLAERGHDVHVVTSGLLYDNPHALLTPKEQVRGVTVHRIATTRFGRAHLLGRTVDYASFYGSLWQALRGLLAPGDIVVAKTDPPLLSIPIAHLASRRAAKVVNWLHDLYPEIAVELGVKLLAGPGGALLTALRDRSLKSATANVVLGQRMAEQLGARGIPSDRIHIIPNWTDDEQINPIAHAENPLRHEWNLQNKFVVGYSGNLGRAYEFQTVLHAAERFRGHPSIVFTFIGGGFHFEQLRRQVAERNLDAQFRFFPYQERDRLKHSLALPDVHWVSLKPELEGLIFPSKFYGIAAAGRPVMAITAPDGEIARLVEEHGCGFVIPPGDAVALADAIALLQQDPAKVEAMGTRSRAMLESRFTRSQALSRWTTLLENLV